jgi:hypothetical protein
MGHARIVYWGLINAVLMSTTEARDGRDLRAFSRPGGLDYRELYARMKGIIKLRRRLSRKWHLNDEEYSRPLLCRSEQSGLATEQMSQKLDLNPIDSANFFMNAMNERSSDIR